MPKSIAYEDVKWIKNPIDIDTVKRELNNGWVLLGIDQEREGDGEGNWIATHTTYILANPIE